MTRYVRSGARSQLRQAKGYDAARYAACAAGLLAMGMSQLGCSPARPASVPVSATRDAGTEVMDAGRDDVTDAAAERPRDASFDANRPVCEGFVPRAPHCTTDRECDGAERCATTSAGQCRPCIGVAMECESDDDCEGGHRCVVRDLRCACPEARCEPACTEGSCGADERCDDGRCRAASCTEGEYACPRNARCVATSDGADDHGCLPLACDEDSECDCGLCLDGYCAEGMGTCVAL